jgi:WD40 repeat protein
VIRAGRDGGQAVARFEAERQALALMNHPNIAQILDGGTTADGRPFLVMELVKGTPITSYCDEHRLSLRQRLELFVPVCHAIQHAHQKGVIHRDIKPSNVLVAPFDGTPIVKVIDFGVAKAAGQRLTERTLFTEFGAVIGTLEYMSPEQAELNNQDVDTRSDIYSLGVLLYELLTGTTPLTSDRRKHSSLLEVLRSIREEDPPRPSTRVGDSAEALPAISARRQTDPARLRRLMQGELDWIVMKALEKQRARRYDTANSLAHDIQSHLDGDPVEACPPSVGYRMSKFLHRYKGAVMATSSVLGALVLGLLGTLNFAVGEARQRGRAEQNARLADEKREAAVFEAYRARLEAAGAAVQNHDISYAAHQLKAAPGELRDWEWYHLQSRLDDCTLRIAAEPGATLLLFRIEDETQIGQILPQNVLRLHDLNDRLLRSVTFGGEEAPIANLIQAHGSLRLLEFRKDKSPKFWDETAAVRFRPRLRYVCDLSPDGTKFAMPGPSGAPGQLGLALYDTSTGRKAVFGAGHVRNIWAIAFSPDGKRVASADDSGLVYVWDSATGLRVSECLGHSSKVLSLAFRPDGSRLVTTSADSTVRQWDPATGKPVEPPYDRHSGEVIAAAYSPDGNRIVSGGTDRTVRLWAASGREEAAVLHGHTGAVTEVAFTPDGQRLVSLSRYRGLSWATDNTAGIWEADFHAGLPVLRGHSSFVYPVTFSPDGRWIASGGWDGKVCLWDAATGERCLECPYTGIVRTLTFSPSGRWFVTGVETEKLLRIWDVDTGRVRRDIKAAGRSTRLLCVSPDENRIAATSFEKAETGFLLTVYDVSSGEVLFSTQGGGLAYSPDGRWLATRSVDGKSVILRDAMTHQESARLIGHDAIINSATFSPDGRYLASCSQDRTTRLWDLRTGECRILQGHTDEVLGAAFHPGGTRIATCSKDRTIWLWDLKRGEEVARLQGHTSYVWSLAFSPDGKTLVSGSGDGTVRLWDTAPLAVRYQARRDAEALRPQAEDLVERLFREKKDADAVVSAIRADRALSEPLRHAALRAILGRGTP